jgi:hypothetical protein
MGYYIDLTSISIDEYRERLRVGDLLPSRLVLKKHLDERFYFFSKMGIRNLTELQKSLKKKAIVSEILQSELFDEEYIAILLREINSLQPKPNKIKEFPYVSGSTVSALDAIGIKDSFDLFSWVKTSENRRELAQQTGIAEVEIARLTKLADLSRIRWTGATFANALLEAGFDSAEKVSKANYEELHRCLLQLNEKKNLFKGKIGLHDLKLCVDAAKEVSLEIEY